VPKEPHQSSLLSVLIVVEKLAKKTLTGELRKATHQLRMRFVPSTVFSAPQMITTLQAAQTLLFQAPLLERILLEQLQRQLEKPCPLRKFQLGSLLKLSVNPEATVVSKVTLILLAGVGL